MGFLRSYLRNLLIIALVFIFMLVFTKIFYPDTLAIFPLIGQIFSGFNLWPLIILMLLVLALPRRRHK